MTDDSRAKNPGGAVSCTKSRHSSQRQQNPKRHTLKRQTSDYTVDISEAEFSHLCRQLKSNDPDVSEVTLGEDGLTPIKAIQLGYSLEGNTKVNKLVVSIQTYDSRLSLINITQIDFSYVKQFCGSLFGFVKYLEKSGSLRTVVLLNADLTDLKVGSALLVMLPGVAKNAGITSFEMRCGDLVCQNIFVALWYTILHALFGGNSTINMIQTSVACSLSQCRSIESLVLENLPEVFNCQLLPELSQFPALNSLTFTPPRDYSAKTLDAMAALVRGSMTLETLQLERFQFTFSSFMPLAESLVETMSVKELSISDCKFKSTSTQMLEDVATTMTKLTVGADVKFSRPTSKVMTNIVSQTDETTLKELDLTACPLPGKHLTRFLSGVEESESLVLERLSLPAARSSGEIDAIKRVACSIPSLKEINVARMDIDLVEQRKLVDTLKANSNLLKCRLNDEEIGLSQPKEKNFQFKLNRQRSLRRNKNLRNTLTAKELKDINDKDEYLQRKMAFKAQGLVSDSEDQSQSRSHREKMVDATRRHGLSDRVLNVLKDDDSQLALQVCN